MKFIFEHYKFFLEPACVAGLAALSGSLKGKLKKQKTLEKLQKNVLVLLSALAQ